MDWHNYPVDILTHICVLSPYKILINLLQTSRQFHDIGNSPIFWRLKSSNDFAIDDTYYKDIHRIIAAENEKEIYLFFAGINKVLIPGAEKHVGFSYILTCNDTQIDIDYCRYAIKAKCQYDDRIACAVGRYETMEVIKKYIAEYVAYSTQHAIITGAIMSGNIHKVRTILSLVHNNRHNMISFITTAIKFDNFTMFEFLCNNDGYVAADSIFADKWLMYQAAYYGRINMVEFLMSRGNNMYLQLLKGAYAHGDERMITYGNNYYRGVAPVNKLLKHAAMSTNVDLVTKLVRDGATDFELAIFKALMSDNLIMIKKLIELGAVATPVLLLDAINTGNLSITKYLLSLEGIHKKFLQKISDKYVIYTLSAPLFMELLPYLPKQRYPEYIRNAANNLNIIKILLDNAEYPISVKTYPLECNPVVIKYIEYRTKKR